MRAAATAKRSAKLFQAFRVEQSDPNRFYSELAADAADQVARYCPIAGSRIVDVGGGPGYFAEAFQTRGGLYTPLDADAGELELHGRSPLPGTVLGDGERLPFRNGSVDIAYSSNVAEHVPNPTRMFDEMVRITRPGGTVFISYTLWFGPHGGHETAPWHFLGGKFAADRYARTHGKRPKNDFGSSMYAITAATGLQWARQCREAELVEAFPRYLPGWSWGLTKVPVLREFALWNLMLVMRKR